MLPVTDIFEVKSLFTVAPDNSNHVGKSKKDRVIERSKQITGKRK